MKPNPKAIKALQRVMTLDQRKEFVSECIACNGENFLRLCTYETCIDSDFDPYNVLRYPCNSFLWTRSKKGFDYWCYIFAELTEKERATKLFIK
jgi:hypothetical protein